MMAFRQNHYVRVRVRVKEAESQETTGCNTPCREECFAVCLGDRLLLALT